MTGNILGSFLYTHDYTQTHADILSRFVWVFLSKDRHFLQKTNQSINGPRRPSLPTARPALPTSKDPNVFPTKKNSTPHWPDIWSA